jgi:hypothetical protein
MSRDDEHGAFLVLDARFGKRALIQGEKVKEGIIHPQIYWGDGICVNQLREIPSVPTG